MFFFINFRSIEMTEQLQSNNFAAEYAELLRKELLLDFDFGLKGSCCDGDDILLSCKNYNCDGDDVSLSYKNYDKTSFVIWKTFCSTLL